MNNRTTALGFEVSIKKVFVGLSPSRGTSNNCPKTNVEKKNATKKVINFIGASRY
jgi:hypothetical protein